MIRGLRRAPPVLLAGIVLLLAILVPPAAQARHRRPVQLAQLDDQSPAAADPQARALLHLGRLVALAPRCGVRDQDWAQRLDVGLLDALNRLVNGGPAQNEAQLLLASGELSAVHQYETQGTALCDQLRREPDHAAELRRADQLAGGTPAPVQTPHRAATPNPLQPRRQADR